MAAVLEAAESVGGATEVVATEVAPEVAPEVATEVEALEVEVKAEAPVGATAARATGTGRRGRR